MNSELKLLRIVPPENPGGGYTKTQGTKVLMPDGTSLPAVNGIVIRAEPDGLWRAEISCFVQPPDVTCLSDVQYRRFSGRESLWFFIKAWWAQSDFRLLLATWPEPR